MGLSSEDIGMMLSGYPTLLSCSLETDLVPCIDVLRSIFYDDVHAVLTSHSQILAHPPDDIRTMYRALVKYTRASIRAISTQAMETDCAGWGEKYLSDVLKRTPMALTAPPANIDILLERLRATFKWPPSDLRHFIRRCPNVQSGLFFDF